MGIAKSKKFEALPIPDFPPLEPTRIEPDLLAGWLKNPDHANTPNFLVVDARDDDFPGGNIKGARNILRDVWLADEDEPDEVAELDRVIEEITGHEIVIFHCMHSIGRGPFSAQKLQEILQDEQPDSNLKIAILNGGWEFWSEEFVGDSDLVENEDVDVASKSKQSADTRFADHAQQVKAFKKNTKEKWKNNGLDG